MIKFAQVRLVQALAVCLTPDPEAASLATYVTVMEINQEIFSLVIFTPLLNQEWQLSVTGKRMCTKYLLTS